MNRNWAIKKWQDVLEIRSGRNQTDVEDPNGKYPILGSAGKIMGYANDYICEAGTTIVGRKGTIDNPLFIETKFWNVDTAFGLHALEGLDKKYLFYFCRNYDFAKQDKGSGRPSLVKSDLLQIEIPVPPHPEQKRIVAILDEAFEGIATAAANAELNLANARELFESYLQNIRADKKPLGDFVSITTGKLDVNAFKEDGEYPFFTCSRQIYAIDTFAFDCEAILLAGNNASGDFNVKHYKGKFNAYQRTYVITIERIDNLMYRYLYFQLVNSLRELKNKSIGANTRFLKLGMVKDLCIPLPSYEEQQTLVAKLDVLNEETKKLEALYQQKLKALDELKKSILDQAFSGQL